MRRISYCVLLCALALPGLAGADGLMIPSNPNYPKDFLRPRLTHVTVKINGMVAQTSVYQEFVNEDDEATDAVYSFPVPPNARPTEFVYWHENRPFKAILEEKSQVVNPGTGEGGTAAQVNRYLSTNAMTIELKGIKAGDIQRVRLDYVELVEYFQGRFTYRYPLDTGAFTTNPIDQLQFNFEVQANSSITGFDIPTHPDFEVLNSSARTLEVEMSQPKAFLNQDLVFHFDTDHNALGAEFYSTANDSTDGHFLLFVRPPNKAEPEDVLPKRVFFLLSNSSRMFGARLTQSVAAISRALDLLNEQDEFTIVLFSKDITPWSPFPVPAQEDNIRSAKNFLAQVSTSFGSRLDEGLKSCLQEVTDDHMSNTILIFADGRSPLDPEEIAALNTKRTGIFPIGIGDDLDRNRLEMTAALNYGFTTYLDDTQNLEAAMLRVFEKINQPVLANTFLDFDRTDLREMLPVLDRIPSTFAGSFFSIAGRYREAGTTSVNINGLAPTGVTSFDFDLDFTEQQNVNSFVGQLWAKEAIDTLERRIAVFGEDEDLRRQVVDLSFDYNLRSRFTAFTADYQTLYETPVDEGVVVDVAEATAIEEVHITSDALPSRSSFVEDNYPNPFNATTTIRLYIGPEAIGEVKLLKIYNAVGQLVDVIDISHLPVGWHKIQLDADDAFGRPLASGLYFVRLQIDQRITSTIRISLIR